MSKKKRLGRGLEALLGVGSKNGDEEKPKSSGPKSNDGFKMDQQGTEVDSVDDLLAAKNSKTETSQVSTEPEDDEPKILPFTRSRDTPSKTPPKPIDSSQQKTVQMDSVQPETKSESKSGANSELDIRTLAKPFDFQKSDEPVIESNGKDVVDLNVYDVDDNPFQPRREFNKSEIESLAESLKTHEQLQPILVRKMGERYQLISGERRLRAAIHAGWSKIRAQVRDADDRLVAELAIVENLQRKDLNPVEKALSFRRYIDEHGCSQEDLAGRLKIDRSTVANLLRLLELPVVVQKALQVGLISNGHARALLPLGEEHLQIEFCNRIQREGLSVRATEQMVRDKIDEEDGAKRKVASKSKTKSGQILALEKELRNALGTKIEIKASSRGRGKIVVHYASRDEFERLRQFFGDSDGGKTTEAA